MTSLLRPQGLFVFTVESIVNEEDSTAAVIDGGGGGDYHYRLLKSGRFGYDKKYIDTLISGLGASYSVAL